MRDRRFVYCKTENIPRFLFLRVGELLTYVQSILVIILERTGFLKVKRIIAYYGCSTPRPLFWRSFFYF